MLPRTPALLALGTLIAATTVACQREQDAGAARFRAAHEAPCLLFRDALLDPTRPPVACPWPAVGAAPDALPCAIDYFIGDEPRPRVTRRLAHGAHGRLVHFSDHRDGQVVEARRITYEAGARQLVVHDYAVGCETPAPSHLFSQTYDYDEAWRLVGWESGGRAASIRYAHTQELLSAVAVAHVSGLGRPHWTRFDEHGHVLERGMGEQADTGQRSHWLTLDHDGANVESFVLRDAHAQRTGSGRYAYEDGRPVALTLETPGRAAQRYEFRYECDQGPTCTKLAPRRRVSPATPTALDLDPKLTRFVARDCSDHFALSGNTCGRLLSFGGGYSVSCCKTSVDEIQIRSDSPFTRGRVDGMRLEDADGHHTTSKYCAKADDSPQPPWACRFSRAELLSLKGPGTIRVLGRVGQTITSGRVDLDALARVAR